MLDGLRQIGRGRRGSNVRHGTTVGTNTMLERTGARVAFVTTAGFEDTIAIGRQTRSRLYDWFAPVPVCLVPRELRFGVPERVSAEGEILRAPTDEELAALVEAVRASGAEAVAISLLFSFANPETERRVEAALRELGIPVSASHRILPEFREYERASTTVVNAYLAPRMQSYLDCIWSERVATQHAGGRVDVMQSSGGIIPARLAAREPVRTVLVRAGGRSGGRVPDGALGRLRAHHRLRHGRHIDRCFSGRCGDGGARAHARIGGGRRADRRAHARHSHGGRGRRIDCALRCGRNVARGAGVGRRRSGADLFWARRSADRDRRELCAGPPRCGELSGRRRAAGPRAHASRFMREQKGALATVEEFAAGILRVVETQMEKAIRVISVERGHDPRDFTLVAFGGGGPLHACSLARALRIPHGAGSGACRARFRRWAFCWPIRCAIIRAP